MLKKNYNELINVLNNFHAVALIDNQKVENSRWMITLNKITRTLYDVDYLTFLKEFPINKPIIMPGVLEAHYNFINLVVEFNENLIDFKANYEMYACANDVKFIFNEFLYRNKYQIHRSQNPDKKCKWYNIVPVI